MKRKTLSLLLVLVMAISLFPLSAFAADYSDTANHWAEAEIERWSSTGILAGSEGKFRPDDSITRAEMATIFDRVMAYSAKAENKFSDLGNAWYTDAILRANAAGLMLGDGGTVRPNDKITRQEAAILVCRAMGIAEKAGVTGFVDDADIAGWAKGYVNALSSVGLIAGVGNNRFAPKDSINRASVVKMLDNSIKGFYIKAGEYTGDVNGSVVVNAADVKLKNMTISGNLIIAEGVGDGDVTLDNVKVEGQLIARGGGKNSIHIVGNSQISSLIISKTDTGGIRIVTESGSVVEAVFVNDGKDDVILTGQFKTVTVETDVPVSAVNATISSVSVTAEGASLNVDKGSKVDAVTVSQTAKSSTIKVEGEVGSLTANAEIKIDNQGTIKKAEVNADSVIIDGNKPADLKVGESVKEPPKSSDGKPAEGGGTSSGGGTGGGGGPVVVQAEIIKAPLHDNADQVADDALVQNYAVTGTVNGNTVNVSISGNHLMEHKNANNTSNYWIGFGIPKAEGNAYYAGFGSVPESLGEPIASIAGREYTEGGKTYNTVYFGLEGKTLSEGAYVVVKNGEKTTTYQVTFNVTFAPDVENMEVWFVTDKDSYEKLPAAYVTEYPWDEAYESGFPWLVVNYTRNVSDTLTLRYTLNGHEGAFIKGIALQEGNKADSLAGDIGARSVMYGLAEDLGISEETQAGIYLVTLRSEGETSFTKEAVYNPNDLESVTVTFKNGDATYLTKTALAGTTIGKPSDPAKTGYTFGGWYTTDAETTWNFATDKVTENVTLNAKWTANTYTISFNANAAEDASGTTAEVSATYDEAVVLTANGFARDGHTFTGWNTKADGTGTAYADESTVENLAESGTVTLYAQWEENTYTIQYNHASATDLVVDYTEEVTLSNDPGLYSSIGYEPTGWNTKKDGTGTKYNLGQENVSRLGGKTVDGEEVNLYLQTQYAANFRGVISSSSNLAFATDGDDVYVFGMVKDTGTEGNPKYKVGFSFHVPASAATAEGTIITIGETDYGKDDLNVYVGEHYTLYSFMATVDLANLTGKTLTVKVDWDGTGGTEARTYTLDFSPVVAMELPAGMKFNGGSVSVSGKEATYDITLDGTVTSGLDKYAGLFATDSFKDKNPTVTYAVINDLEAAGITIKQKNPALFLYDQEKMEDNIQDRDSEDTIYKEKAYEKDGDYQFMLVPGKNVTITASKGDSKITFHIINNVTITG